MEGEAGPSLASGQTSPGSVGSANPREFRKMGSGSTLIMIVQAAEAASGQEGERRPFGGPFDPDVKIVNDFGADVIFW